MRRFEGVLSIAASGTAAAKDQAVPVVGADVACDVAMQALDAGAVSTRDQSHSLVAN